MSKLFQGTKGATYRITEPALAGGGEGNIYAVEGFDEYVIKIFKQEHRTQIRESKLLKMIRYTLTEEQLFQITWPLDVIYDSNGFAGYLMKRLDDNKNLNVIYSSGNDLDLRHRVVVAYNLCAAIDTVHSLGQVCGDLNPMNICVNLDMSSPTALRVTLVDTDSYHIVDDGNTYRCEVGLANYLAPEIQKKMVGGATLRSASLPTYSRETDLFALSVHIFSLLMNGCHPYACAVKTKNGYENDTSPLDSREEESVVLPQPIENIKNGFFPFNQERPGITYPLYAPDMKRLPIPIQNMFIRAFDNGYYDVKARPSAQEWMLVLEQYQTSSQYEVCEKKHYYIKEATDVCPYCQASIRMQKMMQSIKKEEFDFSEKHAQTTTVENETKSSTTNTSTYSAVGSGASNANGKIPNGMVSKRKRKKRRGISDWTYFGWITSLNLISAFLLICGINSMYLFYWGAGVNLGGIIGLIGKKLPNNNCYTSLIKITPVWVITLIESFIMLMFFVVLIGVNGF